MCFNRRQGDSFFCTTGTTQKREKLHRKIYRSLHKCSVYADLSQIHYGNYATTVETFLLYIIFNLTPYRCVFYYSYKIFCFYRSSVVAIYKTRINTGFMAATPLSFTVVLS